MVNTLAHVLLYWADVQTPAAPLIGIRHVGVGTRRVVVLLTRNEGGSVAGQCLLAASERPIIDGPKVAVVLAIIEDVLEILMLSRGARQFADLHSWGAR